MFGTTAGGRRSVPPGMAGQTDVLAAVGAPTDRPVERLDVRAMGPPGPLKETLETLPDLEEAVLVQVNDRAPQHLYPRLDERGYEYGTVETEEAVVTAIWE